MRNGFIRDENSAVSRDFPKLFTTRIFHETGCFAVWDAVFHTNVPKEKPRT
jgi:hypothetical protein